MSPKGSVELEMYQPAWQCWMDSVSFLLALRFIGHLVELMHIYSKTQRDELTLFKKKRDAILEVKLQHQESP